MYNFCLQKTCLQLLIFHMFSIDCLVRVPQDKINEVEPQCNVDVEEDLYTDYFEHIMETEIFCCLT